MNHRIFNIKILFIISLAFWGWGNGSALLGQGSFPTVAITANQVSCPGGSDASAQAFISGQSPGYSYTYLWSTGATTPSVVGLTAGVYSVTVTESPTGYQFFDLVIIAEPDPLSMDFVITDVPCFGQNQGGVDLTVTGGTPSYTYAWTNSGGQSISSSQDLSNLAAGVYNVTVTDSRGCNASRSISISTPATAVSNQVTITDVSCFLGSDGRLNASAFGGTPPYNYSWNTGAFTGPNLSNLPVGTYTLEVTDANGCISTSTNLITQPFAIQTSFTANQVSCFDGSDGSIDVSVSGGTSPYNYLWTSSLLTLGNSQDLNNLPADQYNLTITDANGCIENLSTNITQPTEISPSAVITAVACAGDATGAVDLSVSGGVLPYRYVWTNASGQQIDTTQDISNLLAGDYEVSITDANGCIKILLVSITEPSLPLSLEAIKTDVLCFGENTGAIDLTALGGTPPYQYNWSNGLTTEDINQLQAASYSVVVTDNNGCTENLSVEITQPSAPIQVNVQVTPATCYGFSDGAIDLDVSGGTPVYEYSWKNSQFALSFVTEDLSNIQAETYFLNLVDANGCVYLDTILVDEPDQFVDSVILNDVLCFGDNTGSIDFNLKGGTTPYIFQWSNGSFQEDLTDLPADIYDIQVTDDQGCIFQDSYTITEPLEGLNIQANVKDATCAGGRDGSISYEANGGTPPYTYVWSNNSTEENQFDLVAGLYSVLLTDANGCTKVDSFEIKQPDFFDIEADITPVKCAGESNGSIRLTSIGGTAPYEFLWRNSEFVLFEKGQNLENFPGETYTVVITDTFGCKGEASFLLPEPDTLRLIYEKTDVSCFGAMDGMIELKLEGGTAPYEYLWNNQETGSTLSNLGPGLYEVLISDAGGCMEPLGIEIEEPDPLRLFAAIQPASCIDKPDAVVDLFVSGGRRGYQYFYNNEEFSNPANLLGGDYQLRVMDQTGCMLDTALQVPYLDAPCLVIPNAFSPNGDGKNDLWRIKDLNIYPNPQIIIFNQWGMKLFESNSNQFEWDGNFGGNPLPSQTYYYLIRPRSDRAEISGSITIVR
ncbi:MAG: gliding motility-associated C-terminal domain-containing protein [Bacteroidia bacterium]|nr:gliding motility-associated C-terminal domain-containing protein [Bacteroidia bacterium]